MLPLAGAGRSARDVDVRFLKFTIWESRSGRIVGVYQQTGRAHEISKGLRFSLGLEVLADSPTYGTTRAPEAVVVRYELEGLAWGATPPEPKTVSYRTFPPWGWNFTPRAQGCTVAGRVAECRVEGGLENGGWFGWLLDVVAGRGGSYLIRVAIVDPPASVDIEPRDNVGEITVIFSQGASPAGVTVGSVKMSRPKPWLVKASVSVTTRRGLPVMPKGVKCTASFGTAAGVARPGLAQCSIIFNNARHRGRTLAGTLRFTANGKPVMRSFSLRV